MNSSVPIISPPSTVGRANRLKAISTNARDVESFEQDGIHLYQGNSLDFYKNWETPTTIISDGAYGILGFDGDTSNHNDLISWYEPHIKAWSEAATPYTSLWFWNTEIGWATIHPLLESYGWKYINLNIWNKGKAHIAGNINTNTIRRFPVVTEVCGYYVYDAKINGKELKKWLYDEWKKTGLAFNQANIACGVKNVASRKYFDQGHLWYFPPVEMFEKLVDYANNHGKEEHKPYFSVDGIKSLTTEEWQKMRSQFYCPIGYTNVWDRKPLAGKERIRVSSENTKSAHLNQKPLDLMNLILEASTSPNDTIWEPFGGLFSACLAAKKINRKAFSAEIDPAHYLYGKNRFIEEKLDQNFQLELE